MKLFACGQRDLGRQLQRSAPSPAQNIAEGTGRYDGNGRQRFETAIGSARETITHLEIGVAMGCLEQTEVEEAIDCADKIIATLWRLNRKSA